MTSVHTTETGKYPSARSGWIHFGVAAGFLLVITVGWSIISNALGYFVRKEPIPWPARVTVDEDTFQNTSLAARFGPYKLVEDIEQKPDVLETLKIGTTLDGQRYKDRMSNWYVTRLYEDTREPEKSPYRFWVVDIVFYDGGETTVPHVPDICAVAGGAKLSGEDFIEMKCPGSPVPWNEPFKFKALYYEILERGMLIERSQYYLFNVNGEPEVSRDKVRVMLSSLRLRHIFYSKIQFYPRYISMNRAETNKKAKEFMEYCLPAVLKELPTRADIEMYNSNKKSTPQKDNKKITK